MLIGQPGAKPQNRHPYVGGHMEVSGNDNPIKKPALGVYTLKSKPANPARVHKEVVRHTKPENLQAYNMINLYFRIQNTFQERF